MKTFLSFGVLFGLLAMPILTVNAHAATIYPANDGFELPVTSNFQVGYAGGNPTIAQQGGSGWVFSGPGIGVGSNGDAFGITGADNENYVNGYANPTGQAAILQEGGTVEQTVGGFNPGYVQINFKLEQRPTNGQNETVEVFLDSTPLGIFTTSSTNAFDTESTLPILTSGGSHLLEFLGIDGTGDTTLFLDDVSITNIATPEPSSIVALCGLGAMGLFLAARHRRKVLGRSET